MGILRPRPKPNKAYPNSDRYGEDGRRIYSVYTASDEKKPVNRRKRRRRMVLRRRIARCALLYLLGAG